MPSSISMISDFRRALRRSSLPRFITPTAFVFEPGARYATRDSISLQQGRCASLGRSMFGLPTWQTYGQVCPMSMNVSLAPLLRVSVHRALCTQVHRAELEDDLAAQLQLADAQIALVCCRIYVRALTDLVERC